MQWKKFFALMLALCCIAGMMPTVFAAQNNGAHDYTDVKKGSWYYNSVDYCTKNELMNGTGNRLFRPDEVMNRAMFVTVLYRIEGSPAVTSTGRFTDVQVPVWYADAVEWAAENEIVNGMTATTFEPERVITREQMCTMMVRYANYKGYESMSGTWANTTPMWMAATAYYDLMLDTVQTGLENPYAMFTDALAEELMSAIPTIFSDTNEISDWALDAVYTCYYAGIVNGMTETEFVPKNTATRAQCATILHRFMHAITTQTSETTEGDVQTVTYSDQYGVYATDVTTYKDGQIVSRVYRDDMGYSETEDYTTDENGKSVCAYANSKEESYTLTVDPVTGTTEYINQYGTVVTTEYDAQSGLPVRITEGDEEGYRTAVAEFTTDQNGRVARVIQTTTIDFDDGDEPYVDEIVSELFYNANGQVASFKMTENEDVTLVEFTYHEDGTLGSMKTDESYGTPSTTVTSRSADRSLYEAKYSSEEYNVTITMDKTDGYTITVDGETVTITWDDLKNGAFLE